MSRIQLHAYVLIIILGIVTLGAKSIKPLTVEGRPKTTFGRIPLEFKGWYGQEGRFDEETYRQLPAASLLLRRYVTEDVYAPIELAIVYGTDVGSFHQPEYCLEGQGLKRIKSVKVLLNDSTTGKKFEAVSLIMDSEYGHRAYLYWFLSDGVTSTSLGNYKLKLILNGLRRSRKIEPSAMIRISTDVVDSDEQASTDLEKFAEEILPYIKKEFK